MDVPDKAGRQLAKLAKLRHRFFFLLSYHRSKNEVPLGSAEVTSVLGHKYRSRIPHSGAPDWFISGVTQTLLIGRRPFLALEVYRPHILTHPVDIIYHVALKAQLVSLVSEVYTHSLSTRRYS